MARTIAVIQQSIIDSWTADATLAPANSTSQTAKWRLVTYVVAVAIAVFEQILDVFRVEVEAIAAAGVPGTPSWVRAQVLKFQYSATNPQAVQIINYVPSYPTVDTSLQIITRCAVVTNSNNSVEIKVAKSDPPVPLSGAEETALAAYLEDISFAGIQRTIINADSDKLEVVAVIFYNGQYSAVISADVIAAINSYMANLDFNGAVKVSEIEATIRAVTGVTDIKMQTVKARRDTTLYANAGVVYDLNTGINTLFWNTYSGYVEEETTAGHDFATTLTFVPN